MTALYVDTDPFTCEWTENLIAAGHVAPGEVWNRDVWDIAPDELEPFTQVHLFAGIAVWSYALRRAGWPDDRPVWTASCPCQPFSSAGAREGFADERHAWPAVLHLIEARRPDHLLGEQVSSKDGLDWMEVVRADLDVADYVVGALDTCAAGVGAPHRRQRLYFVADTEGRVMGHAHGHAARKHTGVLHRDEGQREERPAEGDHGAERPGADGTFWGGSEWVLCDDPAGSRWRPVEPGSFPLAPRAPGDVGRLRAYGNALCAPQAEAFIRAYLDVEGQR